MNYINREGFKLHYLESGDLSKAPIFVIGSATYYPRLFEHNIYEDLHLVFIDHRGFSEPHESNTFELDQIVEDIEAFRLELGYEYVYLLGHSGHGFMAMAYAEKYQQHVLGLLLSNLAPTNEKQRQDQSIQYFEDTAADDRKQYFYKEIQKLENDIEKDPHNRFSHMNIRMQAHSFYDFTFDGAYLWDDVYNNLEALDYLWGTAFAKYDTDHFINNTTIKTILLLSDYDYLVAPVNLWIPMVENTKIPLIKFSKSGHNPMLEQPEDYHKQLKDFTNQKDV